MEKKKCPKCNETKLVSEFYKDKKRKDGLRCYCKSCGKLENSTREPEYKAKRKEYRKTEKYKEIKRNYYNQNKNIVLATNKKWSLTLKGKFSAYKSAADSRKIEWKLSLENFSELWQKPCYYCGDEINTIGIDRISSDGAYELNNCIPCCATCNKLKLDLKQDLFLKQITKIYEHLCLKK